MLLEDTIYSEGNAVPTLCCRRAQWIRAYYCPYKIPTMYIENWQLSHSSNEALTGGKGNTSFTYMMMKKKTKTTRDWRDA